MASNLNWRVGGRQLKKSSKQEIQCQDERRKGKAAAVSCSPLADPQAVASLVALMTT